MRRRRVDRGRADAPALPPIGKSAAAIEPAPEWGAAIHDAEASHLRLLARQNQNLKSKPPRRDAAPPSAHATGRPLAVVLQPLATVHSVGLGRGSSSNNNREEIWHAATAAAKQLKPHTPLATTDVMGNQFVHRPRGRRDSPEKGGDGDGQSTGTTLARYRRLVGMHARKTLVRITADAAARVVRLRVETGRVAQIQRLVRRFLGRRLRKRTKFAMVEAAERIQRMWRVHTALKTLSMLLLRERDRQAWRRVDGVRRLRRWVRRVQRRKRERNEAEAEKAHAEERFQAASLVVVWWRRRRGERLHKVKRQSIDPDAVSRCVMEQARELIAERAAVEEHSKSNDDTAGGDTCKDQAFSFEGVGIAVDVARAPQMVLTSSSDNEVHAVSGANRPTGLAIDCSKWELPSCSPLSQVSADANATPGARDCSNSQDRPVARTSPLKSPPSPTSEPRRAANGAQLFDPKLDVGYRIERLHSEQCDANLHAWTTRSVETLALSVEDFAAPRVTKEANAAAALLPLEHRRRRSIRLVGLFLSRVCLPTVRTCLQLRHGAAKTIQQNARAFLAKREVSFRRQLHLASLRSEFQAHWLESGALLMASMYADNGDAGSAEVHRDDVDTTNSDDDDVLDYAGDYVDTKPSILWDDVLPTRSGHIPCGLRVDFSSSSRGLTSSSAPSLGLWKWSWSSEQWEPNRVLFDFPRRPLSEN